LASRRPQRSSRIDVVGPGGVLDPFERAPTGAARSADEIVAALPSGRGAPRELVLAGADLCAWPELPSALRALRARGVQDIRLWTDPSCLARPGLAGRLAAHGVRGLDVSLPAFHPVAYAQITRQVGGLARAIGGMAAAAAAGLALRIHGYLLDARVHAPTGYVKLCALPTLRRGAALPPSLSLRVPGGAFGFGGERGLRPTRLTAFAPAIAAAAREAATRGLSLELPLHAGLPPCVLSGQPDALRLVRLTPQGRRRPGQVADACAGCVYLARCPGLTGSYASTFGFGECRPMTHREPALGAAVRPRRPRWSPEAVAHARRSDMRVLRLTLACNQRCVFCPTDETSEHVIHDPLKRLKRLARWRRVGVTRLSLSGGEPTLDPQLPALIRFASRLGFRDIEIVTNGLRLADAEATRALVSAGLTQATVSLHAHDAKRSDDLTAGRHGDFARTVAALDHLARSAKVRVYVNHVVTGENLAALPDFVRFVHERWGARFNVTFASMTPLFRALDQIELLPRLDALRPPLIEALDLGAALGMSLEVLSRPGIPPCVLAPDHLRYSDLTRVGDQTVAEDRRKKVRPERCARCRFAASCAGVWRVYAERYGLDELRPVPVTSG
jgi:molybdenum cofactor biosynthesis enzyme MoaA